MLKVLTLEQNDEWDKVVMSFQHYDVYWLCGYVKAFAIHGDGIPMLFYYEDINARGINVVMKRDIANDPRFSGKIAENTYFDFATPYGYGGWLIEGSGEYQPLFSAYEQWCKDNRIISEFVRFHPVVRNHTACTSAYHVVELGEVICMDLTSSDLIWNNLSSKNRNVIRKAIKNDIRIFQGRTPEIYRTFKNIYDQTMRKDDAQEYYFFEEEFYDSVMNDLPNNSQVFFAVKDNIVIASSIIIMANKKMNYHLSGSLKEYGSLAATNLLLYRVALWGQANGYKSFYLGGGVGSEEDGLFKFKRSFYKEELNHFYIGKKIFMENEYSELLKIRGKTEGSFFPEYRG